MLRQHKFDLMPRFMEIKSKNLKSTQKKNSTAIRFFRFNKKDTQRQKNMPSPYKRKSIKGQKMTSQDGL